MVKVKNDLTGKKFGRLTVLRQIEDYISPKGRYIAKWLCECECGNVTEVAGYQLTSNRIKSCGCLTIEKAAEIGRGRLIDLVGEKFGRLEVLERVSDFNQCVAWRCRCSCGNEIVVTGENLKKGSTKSCGCYLSEKIAQVGRDHLIDLEGKRFGRLVVLNREENKESHSMWRCLCDCGKEVIVKGNNLRRGTTQSCGCYAKDRSSETKLIDITGNRYGHLTVIGRAENIGKETAWNCLCDCGNTTIIKSYNLRHGKVDCCEICSNKRPQGVLIDMVGCKFGLWTVLNRDSNIKGQSYWNCLCDCGNTRSVLGSSLREGKSYSCGCYKFSKGEMQISKYLKNNKIEFEAQKRFVDCKDIRTLPFDFYLPKYNICIEYDGRQHFEPVGFTNKNVKEISFQFETTCNHDLIKTQYCEDNNIKLIRIPYTEFKNIDEILSKILN